MKVARQLSWVLTGVLALLLLLFRFEWPLPSFAQRWIKGQLSARSLSVDFQGARFDFAGDIRLSGVAGRYQGLVDFSADEVLLRLLTPHGPDVILSRGKLHTGFLPLPLPETIRFNGTLRLGGTLRPGREGLVFAPLRLRAGSLVTVVEGRFRMPVAAERVEKKAAPSLASALPAFNPQNPTEKELCRFLATLCSDSSLWVANVTLSPKASELTLSGRELQLPGVKILSPVLRAQVPFSHLFFSADAAELPGGVSRAVAASYSADEGALWRVIARDVTLRGATASALSASAHWPIFSLSELAAAQDIAGSVNFGERCLSFTEGRLSPLALRLRGRLPEDLLPKFGVKIAAPATVSARLRDNTLTFRASFGAGDFYSLPFQTLSTSGKLSATEVKIDRFDISDGSSRAQGSLIYDISTHRSRYTLVGRVNPGVLPWFGQAWRRAFEPFGERFYPLVALKFETAPGQPAEAHGVAFAVRHPYRAVALDQTFAVYDASKGATQISFLTRADSQELRGQLRFDRSFSATLSGHALPSTLARAYLPSTPPVLDAFHFAAPPSVQIELRPPQYKISLEAPDKARFYSLDLSDLKARAHSDGQTFYLDGVDFGFAQGRGGLNLQVNSGGVGYGSLWLRDGKLGEWSLLGPLSQMLKTKWLSFAELKLHSADGSFTLEPGKVDVSRLTLWGNEHAVSGSGAINTADKTLDFTVRLKALGGSNPSFGLITAPLVAPLASVMEARLTGPLEKPNWKMQLGF